MKRAVIRTRSIAVCLENALLATPIGPDSLRFEQDEQIVVALPLDEAEGAGEYQFLFTVGGYSGEDRKGPKGCMGDPSGGISGASQESKLSNLFRCRTLSRMYWPRAKMGTSSTTTTRGAPITGRLFVPFNRVTRTTSAASYRLQTQLLLPSPRSWPTTL
jgi:hypothetical protein